MTKGVYFVGAGDPVRPDGNLAQMVGWQLFYHDRDCQYPPCVERRMKEALNA